MLRIAFFIVVLTLFSFKSDTKPIVDCKCGNIPLFGRVRVVNSLADFKVRIVTSLPDLKVRSVSSLPSTCGEWQFVDGAEDFTIQYVDALPDFTVQLVNAFPGTN